MDGAPRSLHVTALLVLLFSACTVVHGDPLVGYYVTTGKVLAASCYSAKTVAQTWSSVSGSVGVCVETTPDTAIASRTTTNYYQGVSCIDGTATGEYHAVAAGTTATVGLNFTCDTGSCATMTIYPASTSASSSLLYIGCHEQLGLPADVDVIFAERPGTAITTPSGTPFTTLSGTPSTSGTATPASRTSGSQTPAATGAENDNSGGGGGGGGSRTGVIVGAVVGSVGGVALLCLAFFLGRRCSSKRTDKTTDPPLPTSGQDAHKPELHGMSSTASPMAWQYPSSHVHTELASNEPPAHQLSSERGPYEFPGSYHYQESAGHTTQGQQSYRPQAPYQ